ncbi:MAG: 3-deoxy-8-phosphooctulonate synthase [Oligosphaeraceae bacterium]
MPLSQFPILPGGRPVGPGNPLLVIAGPCVAESSAICQEIAGTALEVCRSLGLEYVFKASFDKANRTSIKAFRGPGETEGLAMLAEVREKFHIPVITDVHEPGQCQEAAKTVDMLQIPAFLCRQTDLLLAAAKTGKPVNVKKGQFLAPEDMAPVVQKLESTGNQRILLTDRGTTFGYHNLVVDMRGLAIMRSLGCPVVFDATHSVQLPGGQGTCSGGNREFVPPLARAACAVGIDAVFLEIHPQPEKALSDGANSLRLADLKDLLASLKEIHAICP